MSFTFYCASAPILILSLGSILSMLQSVSKKCSSTCSVFGLLIGFLTLSMLSLLIPYEGRKFGGGAYIADPLTTLTQWLILLVPFVLFILIYNSHQRQEFFRAELASLWQMVLLGMLVFVASDDLVTIFVGLELSSIGLYALVGYTSPTRASQEGAIKYFILGSFAAAFLLFGFGLLYATTGSLNLKEILTQLDVSSDIWAQIGMVSVLAGLAFKLALVPFHLWAPDAYEGAPTGVTAFMATTIKIMTLSLAMRFCILPETGNGYWEMSLWVLCALSMLFGNIMALSQINLKRMLAYSSIAHSGYMALALCAMGGTSKDLISSESLYFYLVSYTLTSILAFGIILLLETKDTPNLTITHIKGLSKTHPMTSVGLAIAMFSFAGMPPTVGFIGKFFIFSVVLQKEFYFLAIIGVLSSTIAFFFYLRVIVSMFMEDKTQTKSTPELGSISKPITKLFLITAAALILLSGTFMTRPLMQSIQNVVYATRNPK